MRCMAGNNQQLPERVFCVAMNKCAPAQSLPLEHFTFEKLYPFAVKRAKDFIITNCYNKIKRHASRVSALRPPSNFKVNVLSCIKKALFTDVIPSGKSACLGKELINGN